MNDIIEILVVEDKASDAELTMRTLKKNNLSNQILWLKDGVEALEYLKGEGEYEGRNVESKPKVIFMDLKMPRMDGIEVVREMRSTPNLKEVPVVMMTSSQEEKDRLEAYGSGINSYVVKPMDFNDFSKAISEVGYYWLVLNKPPN